MTQAYTATGTPAPNQMTFADLQKIAVDLGTENGKGHDTRVKFQMKLVEASFYNAIDLEADKHGKDKDDATVLTETYVKARNQASIFDAKAANQRKEISCSRTAIKLGQWPHGGPGEPIATMNSLLTTWGKLKQQPANKGKLDDASNVLMKYARQQTRRDNLMDPAELNDLCFKRQSQERSIEQRLNAMVKELEKIRKIDNSSHLVLASSEITKRVKKIAEEKGKADKARSASKQASAGAGAAAHA